MSEDIGALRRFPPAKLCSRQHLGHGERTRVFPSDENTAAAMVLQIVRAIHSRAGVRRRFSEW
jgi:hypothetical protein